MKDVRFLYPLKSHADIVAYQQHIVEYGGYKIFSGWSRYVSTKDGSDANEQHLQAERGKLEAADAHKARNADAKTAAAIEGHRTNASDGSLRDRTKPETEKGDSVHITGMAGAVASRKSKLTEKELLKGSVTKSISIRELLSKPEKEAKDLVEEFGRVANMPAGAARDEAFSKVQRLADKTYSRGEYAHEISQPESEKQTALFRKATETLLEGATLRHGVDSFKTFHIDKEDVGSALMALALGPQLCKALGPGETHALGNRFLVFGVAPVFGMADEARMQMKQHAMVEVHNAAGNYLSGAAIGMLMEHLHPAVIATSIVGGTTMFISDQVSSPQHAARNKELATISETIDNASNSQVMAFMGRTKAMLGPELYRGTFDIVTGLPGVPSDKVASTEVKQQCLALTKIDMKDGIKVLRGLGDDAWETLRSLLHPVDLQPAFATASEQNHLPRLEQILKATSQLQDSILKMQGRAGDSFREVIQGLSEAVSELQGKPPLESLSSISKANEEALKLIRLPVKSLNQAHALASLEDNLLAYAKEVRSEFVTSKVYIDTLQNKNGQSAQESAVVEKFFEIENALDGLIKRRIETLYQPVDLKIDSDAMKSGMTTQEYFSNRINEIFARKRGQGTLEELAKEQGIDSDRARNWIGISMKGAADHAGCDHLVINLETGEMYLFDITQRVSGMKSRSLVESLVTNPGLLFPGKNIPNERKHLVIGIADVDAADRALEQLQLSMKLPIDSSLETLKKVQRQQLADILVKTISQPSALNIFDTPLPSSISTAPISRQAYELWRFQTCLKRVGYTDWARSIGSSIEFLKRSDPEVPDY